MDVGSIARPAATAASGSAPPSSAGGRAAAQDLPKASAAPRHGYQSPIVSFDGSTGAAILQFRDGSSGEELFRVPSKTTLEYQRSQRLTAAEDARPPGPSQTA
jgi:hypothetical protein